MQEKQLQPQQPQQQQQQQQSQAQQQHTRHEAHHELPATHATSERPGRVVVEGESVAPFIEKQPGKIAMPAQSAESAGRGSSETGLSEGGVSEGGLPSGGGYSGLAAPAREELESLEEFRVVGKGGKVKGGDKGEPVELETRGVQGLAEEEGTAARTKAEGGKAHERAPGVAKEVSEKAGEMPKGGTGAEQEGGNLAGKTEEAGEEGKKGTEAEGRKGAGMKGKEEAGAKKEEEPGAESVVMRGVDEGEAGGRRTGAGGAEGGIEAQETAGWQAERGGEEVRQLEEGVGKLSLGERGEQQSRGEPAGGEGAEGEGAGGKGMRGVEEGLQRLTVSDVGGMRGRGGEGEKTVEGAQGEKAGKVMEKGKGGEGGVSGTPEGQQPVEGVEQGMRRLAVSAQGGESGGKEREEGEVEGVGGVTAGGGVVERAQDVATSAWTSTTGAIADTVKVLGSLTGFAPTSTEVPANAARGSGVEGGAQERTAQSQEE
ncbi:unnamed protein product [Closterium sp. Yama58-4]|nr:unnamed protein product [Closterium sp. Yama58-4]